MIKNKGGRTLESISRMQMLADEIIALVNERIKIARKYCHEVHPGETPEPLKRALQHDSDLRDSCVEYFKVFASIKEADEDLEAKGEGFADDNLCDGVTDLRMVESAEGRRGVEFNLDDFSIYLNAFRLPIPDEEHKVDIKIREKCTNFIDLKEAKERGRKRYQSSSM